jgi:hypothetical protein
MDWQPIETAPKDGTSMLLFYKSVGVVYGDFDHIGTCDWWITFSEPGKTTDWIQWYLATEEDPTHWMPIPPAPIDAKLKETV